MCFYVISKSACLWTRIIALWAFLWFLPTVGKLCQPDQMNHSDHSCTFSPVWVIMWLLRCPDWPNDLPHSEQVWFFTPLWASMCVFREPATPNDLLHWTQLYALSLLWVTMRLLRSPAWLNDWTLVHLASTVGERMSLHFDFVLLRSGTFNTVAFDKLEALYFKDFFKFWKTFNSKTFQAFTCLMFLLNL